MSEIKSTLDLVMEKTKHLHLTSEERQTQKNLEIKKRMNGLLQKFLDQTLSMIELKTAYDHLKKDGNLSDHTIFINEIFNRLNPDGDNQALLGLLKEFCGVNPEGLESVLTAYRKAVDSAARTRTAELKAALAREHHVSGSAVVPNLDADPQWLKEAAALRAKFEKQLDRQRSEVLGEK
jgi:hypothetical protein